MKTMHRNPSLIPLVAATLLAGGNCLATSSTAAPVPAAAATAAQPAEAPKPAMSAAECVVWNRERSFAASVEHHDAAAFADHVHAQAAFNAGSPEPAHGRAAVVDNWKEIIEGKDIKLRWSPGIVTIGGDGSMAISRGPSWLENLRPDAKSHWKIGEFISTWVRDKDGQWRVLFDAGTAPMHPATPEEVAKLVASIPKECPQG